MRATFDTRAAAGFLAERFGPGVEGVEPLGAGDWSRAFSFRLDGRDLVARFGRHREDFERDRKAMAFAGPHLPVPRVLEVGEAPGGFFALSERHFGVFPETLDEAGWRRLLPALLRCLDALRELTAPGRGAEWGDDSGAAPLSWRELLRMTLEDRPGERVSGWRARLRETPAVEALFTEGMRALEPLLAACPEDRHVIHRDLLNRNVLVSPGGSRLEAVFDWGCSVAGDSLYEVAWFTFWAPWYPALEVLDLCRAVERHYNEIGLQVEDFDRRLACYELHIGLEHLAYAAFTRREDALLEVARRTRQVLESLPG
jgi:hygromycin-B 4-O-kinase